MKLFYSASSPYVRKVLVTAMELGLRDRMEIVPANPFEDDGTLRAANPLTKVPALVRDDGPALFDSPLLCAYLIDLAGNTSLVPASGPERWRILRWEALADGLLDAALPRTMERRRPQELQSEHWIGVWSRNINSALDVLEQEIGTLPEGLTLAHIAIGCALGYMDLRHGDMDWRQGRPQLAAWEAAFAQRPAMAETVPAP
jgi:glutathione S-transferase